MRDSITFDYEILSVATSSDGKSVSAPKSIIRLIFLFYEYLWCGIIPWFSQSIMKSLTLPLPFHGLWTNRDREPWLDGYGWIWTMTGLKFPNYTKVFLIVLKDTRRFGGRVKIPKFIRRTFTLLQLVIGWSQKSCWPELSPSVSWGWARA